MHIGNGIAYNDEYQNLRLSVHFEETTFIKYCQKALFQTI